MATNWIDKGGYLSFPRLSAQLRYRTLPLMPGMKFVREEPVIGAKKGDTVNVTRIYNPNTPYPTSPLSENAPIPVTDFTDDQFSIKIQEWGQAFDLTEKFQRLSDFDPDDITTRLLQASIAKWGNNIFANKIKQTGIKYAPVTGTTTTINGTTSTVTSGDAITVTYDGTDPGTWSRSVGIKDLFNLRNLAMDTLKIPPLSGEMSQYGEYAIVCSQTFISTLMQDSSIANALNYAYATNKDGSPFLKGFMGTFAGIQFFLDTQNMSTATDGYNAEAVFFGDDVVAKAEPLAPEIRRKNPLDYGRDQGVAWYALGGYKFVGSTTAAQATSFLGRAIHLTSAASPTEVAA